MTDEVDEVALLLPCSFCGAESEDWCRTRKSGAPSMYLHNARTVPIWDLYQKGRADGKRFWAETAVDFIDHFLPTVVVQSSDGGKIRWVSVENVLKMRDRIERYL